MSDWPGTLPQYPIEHSLAQKNNVIRSAMTYGPDKLRRRATLQTVIARMRFVMTTEEVETLADFYETIAGTGTITWTDFITGNSTSYRLLSPPEYQYIEAGNWHVDLIVEDTAYVGGSGWFQFSDEFSSLWMPV